jgi:hypothetical protein
VSLRTLLYCSLLLLTSISCTPEEEQLEPISLDQGPPPIDLGPRAEEAPPPTGALINPFDWVATPTDEDPFMLSMELEPPEDMTCDPMAHKTEEVSPGVWSYSIETERCHWLTLQQSTALPIKAGDRLRMKVWHFELNAGAPANAHLGLATPYETLLIAEEPIPQPGGMVTLDALFTQDLPQGAPLYFHLDNHGANSWHLLEVIARPLTDDP